MANLFNLSNRNKNCTRLALYFPYLLSECNLLKLNIALAQYSFHRHLLFILSLTVTIHRDWSMFILTYLYLYGCYFKHCSLRQHLGKRHVAYIKSIFAFSQRKWNVHPCKATAAAAAPPLMLMIMIIRNINRFACSKKMWLILITNLNKWSYVMTASLGRYLQRYSKALGALGNYLVHGNISACPSDGVGSNPFNNILVLLLLSDR